ncbi:MAG: hypothetical protein JJT94_07045 [Bernardetiaceae bacterium]|nr:hypothetical protein [Bernardetiaceae bacterium]
MKLFYLVIAHTLLILCFVGLPTLMAQKDKPKKERPLSSITIAEGNQASSEEIGASVVKREGDNPEDFDKFVKSLPRFSYPFEIKNKPNTSKFRNITANEYDKYWTLRNRDGAEVLVRPDGRKRCFLVGKAPDLGDFYGLIFYVYDGGQYQVTKFITFEKDGTPIAQHDLHYYIYGRKDELIQEMISESYIKEDGVIEKRIYESLRTTSQKENEGKRKEVAGYIIQVTEKGEFKQIGLINAEADEQLREDRKDDDN